MPFETRKITGSLLSSSFMTTTICQKIKTFASTAVETTSHVSTSIRPTYGCSYLTTAPPPQDKSENDLDMAKSNRYRPQRSYSLRPRNTTLHSYTAVSYSVCFDNLPDYWWFSATSSKVPLKGRLCFFVYCAVIHSVINLQTFAVQHTCIINSC